MELASSATERAIESIMDANRFSQMVAGSPCFSDELVEQGNLLVSGGVRRQELPEVDFNGFDLGWIVGWIVFRRGLVLLGTSSGGAAPRAGRPSSHHQSSSVRSNGSLTSIS